MRLARFVFIVICVVWAFGGCSSSFEPRLGPEDLKHKGIPTARERIAGLELSIEEYASPNKSRKAFDADIASRGVLPLLVRVVNGGKATCLVRPNDFKVALNNQTLRPLYGYEAAQKTALRGYTWNVLVNTAALGPLAMFFWPATMAGSANQTHTVNRRVEHHFESMELTDAQIAPDDTIAGFLFFALPLDHNLWDNLRTEVIVNCDTPEDSNGGQRTLRFFLPGLGILR